MPRLNGVLLTQRAEVPACLMAIRTYKQEMPAKRRQLRGYDLKQIYGFASLIGVDEAGRGALAGPVVAAAVLVNREFLEGRWAVGKSGRVNDSKQLTAGEREELWGEFEELAKQGQIHANYGVGSVSEVESLNILGATKVAMRRALEGIYPPAAFAQNEEPGLFASEAEKAAFQPVVSCKILIDGLPLRHFPYPHQGVVSGDGRSLGIAMASIIAKVTRDRMMDDLDKLHPGYGFAQHKGYPVRAHVVALRKLGASDIHRRSFAPVRSAPAAARSGACACGP